MTISKQSVIQKTRNWIDEIVIKLQLCPFASSVFISDSIRYHVSTSWDIEHHLHELASCLHSLDENPETETSLLIFPLHYDDFDDYLELLHLANQVLIDLNYTGIYQLASFHPEYRFADSKTDSASNFSNRSPFPMLHILRESSIEIATANFPDIEKVPQNNIKKLQDIGYASMRDKLNKISDDLIEV